MMHQKQKGTTIMELLVTMALFLTFIDNPNTVFGLLLPTKHRDIGVIHRKIFFIVARGIKLNNGAEVNSHNIA